MRSSYTELLRSEEQDGVLADTKAALENIITTNQRYEEIAAARALFRGVEGWKGSRCDPAITSEALETTTKFCEDMDKQEACRFFLRRLGNADAGNLSNRYLFDWPWAQDQVKEGDREALRHCPAHRRTEYWAEVPLTTILERIVDERHEFLLWLHRSVSVSRLQREPQPRRPWDEFISGVEQYTWSHHTPDSRWSYSRIYDCLLENYQRACGSKTAYRDGSFLSHGWVPTLEKLVHDYQTVPVRLADSALPPVLKHVLKEQISLQIKAYYFDSGALEAFSYGTLPFPSPLVLALDTSLEPPPPSPSPLHNVTEIWPWASVDSDGMAWVYFRCAETGNAMMKAAIGKDAGANVDLDNSSRNKRPNISRFLWKRADRAAARAAASSAVVGNEDDPVDAEVDGDDENGDSGDGERAEIVPVDSDAAVDARSLAAEQPTKHDEEAPSPGEPRAAAALARDSPRREGDDDEEG